MNRDRAGFAADAQRALAQGGSYRAVHRAALLLPPGTSAVATRHALEDALRTAEFNDAGRLIVVRALRLRGLLAGASGPQVARALEQAWQVLAPQALPFDAPDAALAPAVYFGSVHAARAAWLQRFALDAPPAEWFWPLALPEMAAAACAADALPLLLAALQADAAPDLVAQLLAWPVEALRRVLAALPVAAQREAPPTWAGAAWAPDAPQPVPGWVSASTQAARAARGVDAGIRPRPSPAVQQMLVALQLHFTAQDPRLGWLVALILQVDTGSWPISAQVVQILVEARAQAAESASRPQSLADAGRHNARPLEAAAAADNARPVPVATLERLATGLRRGEIRSQTRSDTRPHTRPYPWAPWLGDGLATPLGGLLMLLNALEVLRFPAWLAGQPPAFQQAFTAALLARIAGRLRMGENDPQVPLLALSPGQRRPLALARLPAFAHRWPAGFDGSGLRPAVPTVATALALWQRALGRLLRRHAGLGLAHLVARDAGVSVTPTHVDVVLPLDRADLALRRAALDRDPGWLPWFGRIVSFHYVDASQENEGPLPSFFAPSGGGRRLSSARGCSKGGDA